LKPYVLIFIKRNKDGNPRDLTKKKAGLTKEEDMIYL